MIKVCPVCGKEFISNRSANSNREKYCCKECSYRNKIKDLTEQRFGMLVVIKYSHSKNGAWWECKCDCGNTAVVSSRNLLSGITKSCGCFLKQHPSHTTHNLYYSRLHSIWTGMKSRCFNKNNKRYKNYGGRGITVCNEWLEFEPFYDWAIANGYDKNAKRGLTTLDRININGNYEPSNCRFISQLEQMRNRQNTRYVKYNNKQYCLSELAELLNIDYKVLWQKLKRNNWDTSILFEHKELPVGENTAD